MGKTKMFRVLNNRIYFKCPDCGVRKYFSVPLEAKRRSIRCTKCGSTTNCLLNRRTKPRDRQAGKAVVILPSGREIDIDLHDISMDGIGFDLPFGIAKLLRPKQLVSFRCAWNPSLIGNCRYVIKSIDGRRVGAQKKR